MTTSRTASARNKKVGMKDGAFGGFTIIEVVLVLAIAGLIFLMVFIALPQLQRAQRDTQRRSDLGRMSSAITQFQTNNNGKIPGQGTTVEIKCEGKTVKPNAVKSSDGDACRLIGYLNSAGSEENTFVDPDGEYYNLSINLAGDDAEIGTYGDHTIRMYVKGRCDGETVKPASNARDYAIVYKLEGNGTYCSDNGGGSSASAKD